MTDTDVTFVPQYHNMDPSRSFVMILTSPAPLPLSRPWAGFGVLWPSQSHPVTQGLPVLESLPFNSISVPGYTNLTTDITLLPNYNRLDLARSHASILPSLPSPVSPLTLDRVGSRVYLPPRTPRSRVCQSQNHSHQSPQVRS
jgi:hypothetical protein